MPSRRKGVLLLELEGRIVFASTHFCDLVGMNFDKVAGTSYFDYVFPDDVEVAKTLLKLSELPHVPPIQFRLQGLDGTRVLVEAQGSPLQSADGQVYAVTGTVTELQPYSKFGQGPGKPSKLILAHGILPII